MVLLLVTNSIKHLKELNLWRPNYESFTNVIWIHVYILFLRNREKDMQVSISFKKIRNSHCTHEDGSFCNLLLVLLQYSWYCIIVYVIHVCVMQLHIRTCISSSYTRTEIDEWFLIIPQLIVTHGTCQSCLLVWVHCISAR